MSKAKLRIDGCHIAKKQKTKHVTWKDLNRVRTCKQKKPINRIISENKGWRPIFPNAAHYKGGFNTSAADKLTRSDGLLQKNSRAKIYSSNYGKLHIVSSRETPPPPPPQSERFLLSVSGFLSGSKLRGEQLPVSKSVHVKKVFCLKSPFKVRGGGIHSRHPGLNQLHFFLPPFLRQPL